MEERSIPASFSGHETFPFRYAWMKKGVDAAAADSQIFASNEAMTRLGVGKNMVRSIRHWCLAAGLLEEEPKRGLAPLFQGACPRFVIGSTTRGAGLVPTDLGKRIFSDDGWDPYLEDPATLWLLHWQIASNLRRATTWNWAFSFYEPEFTKDSLLSAHCPGSKPRA